MLTIRAMTGGKGYAQRHLEHSDYYDEHRKVQGEWHGHGAELLGLHGQVTREQFESVREGLHPETGEFLRPRHSADRLGADGSEQSKGRSLYDLTFSAPKSVSVQALVGGDKRLIAAHERAVREALAEAERYSATRVRLNGANDNRITGNLIAATYRHDTSRELDPQLHTHAVTVNLTYDGVEGRWKALQASDLYERRAYLTEVYRNTLALCAKMSETSRPSTITVGRGKKSHFDEHKQDTYFFRCVGSFGA
jgi:conjugative relaxase-like TrwC/TraI family protein